jgi:glycosyltransferase involved in cell wall biosynthesis
MAAGEAMACGLPGVSFDLEVLRDYYPKGMLKTPCYDLRGFATNILLLLRDDELYGRISSQATELATARDWDTKAKETLSFIEQSF